jgi:hypothetical protein
MFENVKIADTFLGYEDHGILTFMLTLEGNGWGCSNCGGIGYVFFTHGDESVCKKCEKCNGNGKILV